LNSKLHVVCDGQGRSLIMLLSDGQMSDYKGAALMLKALPRAKLGHYRTLRPARVISVDPKKRTLIPGGGWK
jgi:hypothetical protein